MTNPLPNLAPPVAAADCLVYEQPLSERMRTLLRLNFLFEQVEYHAGHRSKWAARAAISGLLDILAILSRGDVRTDVLKELERNAGMLDRYRSQPGVDEHRLDEVLLHLVQLREQLNTAGTQLTQPLTQNEFLNSIKHRSSIPGGTCEFDLPDYSHWLSRPDAKRAAEFDGWLNVVRPLAEAVGELLWLTREGAPNRPEVAAGGLFQHTLERGHPCHLIRVTLPSDSPLFPEISGSRHRVTIRFLRWRDLHSRPAQTPSDVDFQLACC